jgi:hypothetical protein
MFRSKRMIEDGMDCRLMEFGTAFRSSGGSPSPSCATVFRSSMAEDGMNCRVKIEKGEAFCWWSLYGGAMARSSNFRLKAHGRCWSFLLDY